MVVPCCTTWFIGGLLTNCGNHFKNPIPGFRGWCPTQPISGHGEDRPKNKVWTIQTRLGFPARIVVIYSSDIFRHCYRIEEDMVKINLTDWFKYFFEFLYCTYFMIWQLKIWCKSSLGMVLEAYIHGAIKSWAFEKDISFTKHGDHFRDFPTINGTILEALLLLIGLIF